MSNELQPNFKPVYIFGAGASAMLGAPLLANFLTTAKGIRYSRSLLDAPPEREAAFEKIRNSFDAVFAYQSSLYTTREFLKTDLDNLETLFSILDMDWQTSTFGDGTTESEGSKLEKLRYDFLLLIVHTLKKTMISHEAYTRFVKGVAASKEATFITLNYDLGIETALRAPKLSDWLPEFVPWYLINGGTPGETGRKVLKLHGSANWTYCKGCKYLSIQDEMLTPNELESGGLRYHYVKDKPCSEDKPSLVILPPTWYKTNEYSAITELWRAAIKEISLATHILVVGYSMPKTDVFFEQLLALGFRQKKNLQRLIFINPSKESEAVLASVFDEYFVSRKVTFLRAKFENIAKVLGGWGGGVPPVDDQRTFDNLIAYIERNKSIWEEA